MKVENIVPDMWKNFEISSSHITLVDRKFNAFDALMTVLLIMKYDLDKSWSKNLGCMNHD